MVYRAGASYESLAREELEAALEEWPELHRSILMRGDTLCVEDTCPTVIPQGDCVPEVFTNQNTLLAIILPTVVGMVLLAAVVMMTTVILCVHKYRKCKKK